MRVASMAKAAVKFPQEMLRQLWRRVNSHVRMKTVTAKQKHQTDIQKEP